MDKIIIATLSWNGLDKLSNLRTGLIRNLNSIGLPYDWFIRSNGCNDNTQIEILNWPEVTPLIKNHNRDNFSIGVNSIVDLAIEKYGEKQFKNSLLLLLNNDIIFRDDISLLNMFNLLKKENIGQVGCRLMFTGQNTICHNGVIFSKKYNSFPWHYRDNEICTENDKKNYYFQAVTAAVSFVKGEDFLMAGKLCQEYFWGFEDIHLSLTINKILNKKIICCGTTEIDHEQSASLKKNKFNLLFQQHNSKIFKSKWFNKYIIDHENYLNDPCYNEIKT